MTSPRSTVRDAILPKVGRFVRQPRTGDERTILIIQPDHLGDILLSQPAVQALRSARPDCRLIAVVGPWSRDITRLAWPVDDIVTLDFPGFERSGPNRVLHPYRLLRDASAKLRKLKAGDAVVMRFDAWWSAWLGRLSVSGTVAGSADSRVRPFVDLAASTAGTQHATDRALSIVAGYAPEISELEAERPHLDRPSEERSSQVLQRFGVETEYVVVHPGAGAPVKLWPCASWRSFVSRLTDYRVVLTGTANEREMYSSLGHGFEHVLNLAGGTTLDELIVLLANATAVVGTDNGPMHLAVALGTPTVHLYGPSSVAEFGPRAPRERHRVISAGWSCPRCRDLDPSRPPGCGCMLAIPPDWVAAELVRLLESTPAHAHRN